MPFASRLLSTAVAIALLSGPACAAEALSGTLEKIKASGTITLGYRDAAIPFSYLGSDPQQPIGYSQDLQLRVVEVLKQQLGMPQLKVRYVLVTSQTRIPLVQNGSVDLECGSTTSNPERQRQVAFSVGIFKVGTRLLTRKTSGIHDFADLADRSVATTAGTTSERLLKAMNAQKRMAMHVLSFKDHDEAFQAVEAGRAEAFMMDDALLHGEMARARQPGEWRVVGTPQSGEIYACMLRRDDPAFKQLVDAALTATFRSGEIHAIYAKWFTQPIPPNGLNLNFPMSDGLKQLIAEPTDQPAGGM
ncbi:MAG: transporter substrate-binding domain-containing protein [Pseudomonas sp.]|nr:transporter substrate-binding domain-containing protein [Pseudomonas sp.]